MEEFLHACLGNSLLYDTINSLSAEKRKLTDELCKSSSLNRKLIQLLEAKEKG